jgi:rod shape-determining protein MreD
MEQFRLLIAFVLSILLQWTIRSVAEPLAYIDFPLIVVIYATLQGNTIRALLLATIAGISIDALSAGLLGASGFSKTLAVYLASEIVRRVYMENVILRVLMLAGVCLVNSAVYYGVHRLLGQPITENFLSFILYSTLATSFAGIFAFIILDTVILEGLSGMKKYEFFSVRRQPRRRGSIRLGRRL